MLFREKLKLRRLSKKYYLGFLFLTFAVVYGFQSFEKPPKVEVIGIGFPKCSTTAFFHVLEKNRQINFMKRPFDMAKKHVSTEINYFGNLSKNSYVRVGLHSEKKKKIYKPPIKFYNSLIKKGKINVEKSPQYIFKKEALREIYAHNPKIKIILQVRDPVDWLYSYYSHAKKFYTEPGLTKDTTFEEFLKMPCPNDPTRTVLEAAKFENYISNVLEIFPKKQVYLMRAEDLNRFKTMGDLCQYLDLPCDEEDLGILLNFKETTSYEKKIEPSLYTYLSDTLKHTNEILSHF